MTGAQGMPDAAAVGRAERLRRWRAGAVVAAAAITVLVPTALAAARAPRWWSWIASESTPMTWLQSVVLISCAGLALLHAALVDLRGPVPGVAAPASRQRGTWLLVATGFAALGLDERFALHERVRDRVLAPRGIRVPLADWMAPGDFILLAVLLAGLFALPAVRRQLRPDRTALLLFGLGLALTVTALLADSFDPARMSLGVERLEQTLEECVELCAALSYLLALLLPLLTRLADPMGGGDGPSPVPVPDAASSAPS